MFYADPLLLAFIAGPLLCKARVLGGWNFEAEEWLHPKTKPPKVSKPDKITVDEYLLRDIQSKTGVNPYYILGTPDAGWPEQLVCVDPHDHAAPKEQYCPAVMNHWYNFEDRWGNLNIKRGQCITVTQTCCQVTLCSPKTVETKVRTTEVISRLWNQFVDRCLSADQAAIYVNDRWDFLIMMTRTPACGHHSLMALRDGDNATVSTLS